MVHPDNRRGKVVILQGDDGVPHLQWKLRPADSKELDVALLAPATWERVTECKTGRVYLLRFPQTNSQRFFWMQEVSEEKDEAICKQINDVINGRGGNGGNNAGAASATSGAR